VTAQRLWQFGTYLNSEIWNDFHKVVRDQSGMQGCDKDGLTGLTSPLQSGGRPSLLRRVGSVRIGRMFRRVGRM
jgi:hypothetical protein